MDNLLNYSLQASPLDSFVDWHKKALLLEQNADAMSVSTYDTEKQRPNTRYLLYKGIQDNKIVMYTNYLSPKAIELEKAPEIVLGFYWHVSQKQVRIHGKVSRMNRNDSVKYFESRDRESQIASYISHQSATIPDKEALLIKLNEAKTLFEGKSIPCPEHWGGFLIDPYEYEFFLYGANRLNDRFLYQLNNQKWEIQRLQP